MVQTSCTKQEAQSMFYSPKLWDEGRCFDTMIVQDFLLSCVNMLLAGIIWTLTFHRGWVGWVPGLHYFSEWDRQACIVHSLWDSTLLDITFRRVIPQSRHTTLCHFLTSPRKQKTHQMKTCCDVTFKIGFQRICCDKSFIKLVYFSTAYVCNNTAFWSQMWHEEQIVFEWQYPVVEALWRMLTCLTLLCHDLFVRRY